MSRIFGIIRQGSRWFQLIDETGRILGNYKTQSGAERKVKQITTTGDTYAQN
jgi:hypothetical protein